MKEIFTDLYKKVLGFFQAQEEEKVAKGGSNAVAKNRLKLVLMQDRTNLTPFLLEKMRGEMIEVLSKYVEMDQDELELNFEQEGDSMALMLSIPVLRAKEEDEINEILKAEEEAKAKAVAESETEESEDEFSEDNEEEDEDEIEAIGEDAEDDVCSCCDGDCECGCQDGEACTCDSQEVEDSGTSENKVEEKKSLKKNQKRK